MFNIFDRIFDDVLFQYPTKYYSHKRIDKDFMTNFMDTFKTDCLFKTNEDNNYLITFHVGKNVTADMIDVEVNDENRILTVAYKYDNNDNKFSSSVMTSLPKDADIDSLNAVLEDGVLNVTMTKLIKTESNNAQINIRHV